VRTGPLVVVWLVAAALTASCGHGDPATVTATAVAAQYLARDAASGADVVDLYAATRVGALVGAAVGAKPLVYVPNLRSNSVSVIDPATHRLVRTFPTGALPQHVVPSHDLSQLWITNNDGNTLTGIDPATGELGKSLSVDDPYNLYFTPDGSAAMVLAERRRRVDFRHPASMALVGSVGVDCAGLNHLDFTADDRFAIATCEFSGQLVKIDLRARRTVGYLRFHPPSMPQDIRSSPDGRVFYVADMTADGVHVVDPVAFAERGFIPMGRGTHGIVVGRGGRPFYVMNRGSHTAGGKRRGPGSITVLDPVDQKVLATWPIPGGGSPDMGNISADGRELWVSGRYDGEVYVLDTSTGQLTARIGVGSEPHGLCVWPQPGRFSLGHTGNMR
jgi:YVTN family beta-propeller protein